MSAFCDFLWDVLALTGGMFKETGSLFYYIICVHRTKAPERLAIVIRCLTIVADFQAISPEQSLTSFLQSNLSLIV